MITKTENLHRTRKQRELNTVKKMIHIYCNRNHNSKNLCSMCKKLKEYTFQRLTKCPFLPNKPVCEDCPIHCYKKNYRDEIKNIMRFSGPILIFYHPIYLIRQYIDKYSYET